MRLRFEVLTVFALVGKYYWPSVEANQLPSSPCPNVFQYARSGNKYIGLITANGVRSGTTRVEIELSQPGMVSLGNSRPLSLNFDMNTAYEYLEAGRPLTFRVDFPDQNVVPLVTSIRVNGGQICSGPKYNGSPSSSMKFEYSLMTNTPISQPQAINNVGRNPSWPSFNHGNNLGHEVPSYLKFSPSYSQKYSTGQTSVNQPSYMEFFTQSPNNHVMSYQQTFNPHTSNQQYHNAHLLFNQMKYNLPSVNGHEYYRLPESVHSQIMQPPIPQTMTNPQNPFLTRFNGINDYRPPGEYGPRNPPLNFGTPVPSPSWPTKSPATQAPSPTKPPTATWPIFTFPKTTSTTTTTTTTLSPLPRIDIERQDPPTTTTPKPTTTSKKPSINRASFEYINSICGRENVNFDFGTLNVKGKPVARSRFPWIVAVFKRIKGDLTFQCGGSLISTRTIVSAAHCFYLGFEAMKAENILISMGRHNLTDWIGAYNIDAERIITHPDYQPTLINFDADLAIVRLKQSVTFTTAVRPICMWQGPVDAREIEGVSGAIVGWGADEERNTTTIPTLVNATVVSELTCIRANDQFISLTSNRTLCAGNLDGSGPCMGDSGNGLMIRNRNKWMLRGTVSAVLGSAARPCILDQYAIYSDIAMFIGWIRSNMLL